MSLIAEIRRYYLFYGPEEYLKWRRIKDLIAAVITPGFESFDYAVFSGRGIDMTALINNVSSPPMGSVLRVTVLRDIEKLSPKALDLLDRFIRQIPDYSCLVLTCEKLDMRKKIFKTLLAEKKSCIEFKEQTPQKAAEMAMALAAEMKAELSRDNAFYLIETIGTNAGRIRQEIEKLSLYAGPKEPITRETISQMCGGSPVGTITDLPEKVASGDVAGALKILNQLLLARESEGAILYRLKDYFLKLNLAKSSNMPSLALARALGYGESFVAYAEKLRKITAKMSQRSITECLHTIYECEIALKSGRVAKDQLLRQFICRLNQAIKSGNKKQAEVY